MEVNKKNAFETFHENYNRFYYLAIGTLLALGIYTLIILVLLNKNHEVQKYAHIIVIFLLLLSISSFLSCLLSFGLGKFAYFPI